MIGWTPSAITSSTGSIVSPLMHFASQGALVIHIYFPVLKVVRVQGDLSVRRTRLHAPLSSPTRFRSGDLF